MKFLRTHIILLLFLANATGLGQTNPTAQSLPYSQDFSSFTGATTTYPAGWQGWTISGSLTSTASTAAPNGNAALSGGTNATTTAGVYDMAGKMGLLSTGSALRTMCLAVSTTGLSSIYVSFVAGTQGQLSGGRIDELLLQYRVGTSGSFTSVSGASYQNNATSTTTSGTAATNSTTVAVTLPAACDNQSVVQLRWEMRDVSGSGNRPGFSIDDVVVTTCNTPSTQSSNISFSNVYGTSMTVNWTNGTGTSRIVKINTTGFFSTPVNGTSYAANSVYGGSGEQVVYNGSGNTVTVTGLTANTTYWFFVFDYNCSGANSFYITTGNTNNPNSQATCNGCSSPGDHFRSVTTGNWSNISTWESSSDNITWIASSLVPTSSATSVTIMNSHTVTVDANASAPLLTINNGGTLEANATSFVTLTLVGNLVNDGTLQMVNGTKGVDIVFNKNGNQTITGTGGTTNFYSIGLNMGSVRTNYLDVSPSNFSCTRSLLFNSSGANVLQNGTIKLSGTFSWTGTLFQTGASCAIASTAGVHLNNSNVTITASNDSYDVSGLLRVTAGTLNIGTVQGNSIRLLANSMMQMQGGNVNIAGRLQAANSGGTFQGNLSFNQSGGTIVLCTAGQNTSGSIADLDFHLFSDTVIFTGGTIIFRNEAVSFSDLFHYGYCQTTTGGTLQFGDALTTAASAGFEMEVGPGSNVPSILIDNSSGLNPLLYPGTDVIVKGGITIGSGTTLDNYWGGTLYYNFSLTRNWTNNGTFNHNNQKTITFNGSSAQTIGGSAITGFNNLTINNSSGGVTLNTPVLVDGTAGILTLTNGYLYTSSTNTFTMNAGTSVTGANNNSFVYGPMTKTGTTDFTFPVGKDVKYRSIGISSLSASESFTAEYFHSDPDVVPYDVTLKDATLDDIGRCEYWILNRAGAANANVTLSWETYSCGVTSLANLSVARWDGTMWKDHGNGGTTGTTTNGTVVSSGPVTSFSPFTLASKTSGVNPLPVELLDFQAQYLQNNTVAVNWETATEVNNDYFNVERSEDGTIFQDIRMVDGAGNTTGRRSYSCIDDQPLPGISYYRLKQTDFDGNFRYSDIVSVQPGASAFDLLSANTTDGMLELVFDCSGDCPVQLELYDISGRKVIDSKIRITGGNYSIKIPVNELSEGIYLVKALNGNAMVSRKVKL